MRWGLPKNKVESARAQISVEYLAVMGISLLMLMPLFVIFGQQSVSFNEQIRAAHQDRASFELLSATEEVFLLGPPTTMQLRVYFPKGLTSVTTNKNGFVFNSTTSSNTVTYVDSRLPLNLSGTLKSHMGLHIINITATETGVVVGEVS